MKTSTLLMLIFAVVLMAGLAAAFAQTNTAMFDDDDPNTPSGPEFCAQMNTHNLLMLPDDDPNGPELF
jgi:hypothetical protein